MAQNATKEEVYVRRILTAHSQSCWFGRGKKNKSGWLHSSRVLWLFEQKRISSALVAISILSFFLLCMTYETHIIKHRSWFSTYLRLDILKTLQIAWLRQWASKANHDTRGQAHALNNPFTRGQSACDPHLHSCHAVPPQVGAFIPTA